MTRQLGAVDREHGVLQALALGGEARGHGRPLVRGEIEGGGQRDGACHVLRAGTPVALLLAPVLLGQDVGSVAEEQRADALRALELVGGDRHEVSPERANVKLHIRSGLHGIDVEQHATVAADLFGDLGDRLDRAHLVVGEHDRDQDRAVGDRRVQLVRVNPPVAIHRQLDDLEPELLEIAQRMPDGVVLDRRGHDPMTTALARPCRALEGEVVRLGPAGCEDDLAGLGIQARGDSLVRIVERGARGTAERVGGARVAERFRQERPHRLEDLGSDRRRRGVIEVDRHPGDATPPSPGGPYEASTWKSLPSIVTT